METTKRRIHLRYGVRSMLLLLTLVCIFVARQTHLARKQKQAVASILEGGGSVIFDYQVDKSYVLKKDPELPAPEWLCRLVGEEFFVDVIYVQLATDKAIQSGLPHISSLPGLRILELKGTALDDEGLRHLANLRELERLDIYKSSISGAGLAHLKACQNLTTLLLEHSPLGDEGLLHLRRLRSLTDVQLDHTQVGNVGLSHLRGHARLRWLSVNYTQVTDEGLAHLSTLQQLQALDIVGTMLNGEGLGYLERIPGLQEVTIPHEVVESNACADLQAALPNLSISPGR